MKNAVFVT
jgi:hypothetical protein